MAFPETSEDRRNRSPDRDPSAIDTRGSFNWMTVVGVIAAFILLLLLLGSFSTDHSVTNAPADNRTLETPTTPPPAPPTP